MQVDPELITVGGITVGLVWNLANTIYLALAKTDTQLGKRIERVESDISGLGTRLSNFEGRIGEMPTNKQLGEIYERINEVEKDLAHELRGVGNAMSELAGQVKALGPTLQMIHQFLLERK
jgi:hypothetical protein